MDAAASAARRFKTLVPTPRMGGNTSTYTGFSQARCSRTAEHQGWLSGWPRRADLGRKSTHCRRHSPAAPTRGNLEGPVSRPARAAVRDRITANRTRSTRLVRPSGSVLRPAVLGWPS
jgi:hypothetical protein